MPIRNKEKLEALAAKLAKVPTSAPEYKNWMQRLDKAAKDGNQEAKYTLDKTMEFAAANRSGYEGLQEFAMSLPFGVSGMTGFVGSKVGEEVGGENYGVAGSVIGGVLGGLVGASHDIMNIGRNINIKTKSKASYAGQSIKDMTGNIDNIKETVLIDNIPYNIIRTQKLGNAGKNFPISDFIQEHIINRAQKYGLEWLWGYKSNIYNNPKNAIVKIFERQKGYPLGVFDPRTPHQYYVADGAKGNTHVHEIRHALDHLYKTPAGDRKPIQLSLEDYDALKLAWGEIDKTLYPKADDFKELVAENAAIRYRLAGMWSQLNNGRMPNIDELDKYIDNTTAEDILKAINDSAYFSHMKDYNKVNNNLKSIKYALKYVPATIPFIGIKTKQAD